MNGQNTVETISHTTAWFILVAAFACAAYDLWIGTKYGLNATISWTVYEASREWPVLPFILGLLFGHLLWPQRK